MYKNLCLLALLLMVRSVLAQGPVVLPYKAPTVVLLSSLDREKALPETISFFVQQGYTVDFGTLNETQFSTNPREVNVADDLEYRVQLRHTVTLQVAKPLATLHLTTEWNYGDLYKPVDADPQSLAAYKRKYLPVYRNRIRLYIETVVSEFDYTLLAHPLNEKP